MNNKIKYISGYEIETPEGFKPFVGIGKHECKQPVLKFILLDGTFIEVNHTHKFNISGIVEDARDLIVGDCLETKKGLQEIIQIIFKEPDYVYTPLEVGSSDHSYYANDIRNINCKFLGTASTLVDSDVLERIHPRDPVADKWTGLFSIYETPIPNCQYILGVDSAKGTGNDFSVVQVLKIIGEFQLEQVAVYRNNFIIPHDFAQVCISISEYFNNAYIMIENNDIGSSVCDTIWYEYECEALLNVDPKGLGIRSTRKTKPEANLHLKEYLEKGWLTIVDARTLFELSKYEEVSPNVFKCGRNDHDDTVTALLWALFYLKTDYYEDRDEDTKTVEDKYKIGDDSVDYTPPVVFEDDLF